MTPPVTMAASTKTTGATTDVRRLYTEHASELRLGLARLAGRTLDPDDLLHEVFVVALRKRDDLAKADSPKAWLYGVAVKVAASRRRTATLRSLLGLTHTIDHQSAASPMSSIEQRDAVQQVNRALEKLSGAKREVFVLFELQHVPGDEIATALQIPLKTVWTRLFHARKEFAAALNRLEAIEHRLTGGLS